MNPMPMPWERAGGAVLFINMMIVPKLSPGTTGRINYRRRSNSIGELNGYPEFYSDVRTGVHAGWIGTVDMGFTFLPTRNVQLDCGSNFGVTGAADAVNPFVGITVRH
jgi:hypothetical protein